MSQASLRGSEWDELDVQHRGERVTYVFRRAPGAARFEPWVVVAPSAILRRLGRDGLGLYAGRTFRRDQYVGRYPTHDVVGHYPSRQAALAAPETRRRVRRGRDKLIALRAPQGGVLLVDGEGAGSPSPHIERCNDPRGLPALTPNADLTDAGWLRVLHARVPPFDLGKTIDANIASELRIDYGGQEYWDMMERLGTSAAYAIEVED